MSEPPLVSVLIPCYNGERWIAQTLDSALAQTYRPIEIIVVDDGSTDSSVEVLAGYGALGVRLMQQVNRGASAARNLAFSAASGDLIQFLDADDLLAEDKIERQVAALAGRTDAVAMAEWARFYRNPGEACFVPDFCWRTLEPVTWLVEAWSHGGGMLFPAMWLLPRRVAELAGRWNECLTLADDTEYFTRVLLASCGVLFVPGARCYYRSGLPGSLSGLKTRPGWESQFLVVALCEAHLRRHEDSERTRKVCGVIWQSLAHASYPYARDIANHALARARSLHRTRTRPDGGPAFRIASRLLGWKLARRLQRWCGRP